MTQKISFMDCAAMNPPQKIALIGKLIDGDAVRVNVCTCGDPIPGMMVGGKQTLGHFKEWGENPYEDLKLIQRLVKGGFTDPIVMTVDTFNELAGLS